MLKRVGTGTDVARRPNIVLMCLQYNSSEPEPQSPGSGSGSEAAEDKCKAADGDGPKVGLAYDVGGRGDQSFNDSAAAGLDKAKTDFGIAEVKELTAAPNQSLERWSTIVRSEKR